MYYICQAFSNAKKYAISHNALESSIIATKKTFQILFLSTYTHTYMLCIFYVKVLMFMKKSYIPLHTSYRYKVYQLTTHIVKHFVKIY